MLLTLPCGKDASASAAWIEAALKGSPFLSVQRVPGSSTVVAVPATFIASTAPPQGTSVERSWMALRIRLQSHCQSAEPLSHGPSELAQLAAVGHENNTTNTLTQSRPLSWIDKQAVCIRYWYQFSIHHYGGSLWCPLWWNP